MAGGQKGRSGFIPPVQRHLGLSWLVKLCLYYPATFISISFPCSLSISFTHSVPFSSFFAHTLFSSLCLNHVVYTSRLQHIELTRRHRHFVTGPRHQRFSKLLPMAAFKVNDRQAFHEMDMPKPLIIYVMRNGTPCSPF